MDITQIGRYQVKNEIGRGGMATVFLATDPNFEREVAIKVLPQSMFHDVQFRARFEREAKTIALLEHPAIVPVYDYGEDAGMLYIVMRLMSGGSLSERLRKGAMSVEESLALLSRLAPALDAAHARGIIHRDLKPGNILFDTYGNAYLSDFGIARIAQSGGMTLTGDAIIGTPAYMSPEQVQGDKQIDGRSDIYALGVVLFEMLTGSVPYQGDTPIKTMMMHVLDPVPDVGRFNAQLPPGCRTVVAKALAKDPDQRFASAGDMASAMQTLLIHPPAPQDEPAISDLETLVARPAPSEPAPKPQKTLVVTPREPARVPTLQAEPVPERRGRPGWLYAVGGIVVVLVLALAGGVYAMQNGLLGGGSLPTPAVTLPVAGNATVDTQVAVLPSATDTPEQEVVPPPATSAPTETLAPTSEPTATQPPEPSSTPTTAPTNTPLPLVVTGGADKFAYFSGGEIWMANIDGSDLVQLTSDGAPKSVLRWAPGGQSLTYISDLCIKAVNIATKEVSQIACFPNAQNLTDFTVSPQGDKVVLVVSNQLFILPYDLQSLSTASRPSDLTAMASCADWAPYQRNFAKSALWSRDGNLLAIKIMGVTSNKLRGDIIQIMAVDRCIPNPMIQDNLPEVRFSLKNYNKNPEIQTFTWDGGLYFVMNSIIRNEGFGELYIYNREKYKATSEVKPVNNVCCYRDAAFSPDGSYLMFAFQDYLKGAESTTQLYYIPFESIGTGASYTPLPIPDILNAKEKPQPVLRPAVP